MASDGMRRSTPGSSAPRNVPRSTAIRSICGPASSRYRRWIVAAAGTHVVSPSARLAVVGNVLTHADYRGRGYATAVTGAVTAELLLSCDHVALNVRADNPPAISAYRHLGYAEHVRFEERLGHRIGSSWSDLVSTIRRRLSPRKEPPPS